MKLIRWIHVACEWMLSCGLTAICGCARRSWIPARREGVLEANRVFSPLLRESSGLRERSGDCAAAAGQSAHFDRNESHAIYRTGHLVGCFTESQICYGAGHPLSQIRC
jgi:hypothetical protein